MQPYLTPDERSTLRRAARDGLEAAVSGRPPEVLPEESRGHLAEPGACFVTLYARGQLRGCIGGLEAHTPLAEHVRSMASAAALRDPRFPPVNPSELPRIELSLSVLTPLRRVTDPLSELRLGEHGVAIRQGWSRGVLLPQVAVEHRWDARTFLENTCRKAGLPPDAWQHPDTTVELFSAEVF